MEKDYILLRPFDLDAAKRGDKVHDVFGGRVQFVAGPDAGGAIALMIDGHFATSIQENLRMAPLCWVEGKPVYKGDVLYGKWHGAHRAGYVIGSVGHDGIPRVENGTPLSDTLDDITWSAPRVKRSGWVNIYPFSWNGIVASTSHAYTTREEADLAATADRISLVRIEWEE